MEIVLVLIAIIVVLLLKINQPKRRGRQGERIVETITAKLPNKKYVTFHNLVLPIDNEITQIDTIIFSVRGIFVIETKNYTGWIFGGYRQEQWRQVIYNRTYYFMNPLRQNYKHTKAVQQLLKIPKQFIFSIVVFISKSKLPYRIDNVLYDYELIDYIKSKEKILMKPLQVKGYIETVLKNKR